MQFAIKDNFQYIISKNLTTAQSLKAAFPYKYQKQNKIKEIKKFFIYTMKNSKNYLKKKNFKCNNNNYKKILMKMKKMTMMKRKI